MKEAKEKKQKVTEDICVLVKMLRQKGVSQTQIGNLVHLHETTVGRIEKADYNFNTYKENIKIRREQEMKAKEGPTVELVYDPSIAEEYRREQTAKAEEQLPGQLEMELGKEENEATNNPWRQEIQERYKLNKIKAIENAKSALVIVEGRRYDKFMRRIKLDDENMLLYSIANSLLAIAQRG